MGGLIDGEKAVLDELAGGGGQRLRRPLQKCAKALLYPFAMPLSGILGWLGREFGNSLLRRAAHS